MNGSPSRIGVAVDTDKEITSKLVQLGIAIGADRSDLIWRSSVQLFVHAMRADGKVLLCNVLTYDNDRWIVGAVETSAAAIVEGGVFSDHGHKAIGTYPDLRMAMNAAESYARAWQRKFKSTRAPACTCDEIPAE